MSTAYSIGQMNQLGDALEAAGFTPDDVTKLRSFSRLGEFKNVLKGYANIVKVKHIVDLDADPFVPDGWTVEEHQKCGQLEWDPTRVALYLSENQKNGKGIEGTKLRKELAGKPVLNANVLDYLLSYPELIPEEWKEKLVFFWGTIYRRSGGNLYVRDLCWGNGRWDWGSGWLGSGFHDRYPAPVLASSP